MMGLYFGHCWVAVWTTAIEADQNLHLLYSTLFFRYMVGHRTAVQHYLYIR